MQFFLKNLKLKVGLFVVLFLSMIFIVFFQTYQISKRKKLDGPILNLINRQKVIINQYVRDFFYFLNTSNIEEVQNTIKIFEETQQALISSGKAPIDLQSSKYIIIDKERVKGQEKVLTEINKQWASLKTLAVKLIDEENRTLKNYKKMIQMANQLIKITDQAVMAFQISSQKSLAKLQNFQMLVFGLTITLFIFTTFLLYKFGHLNQTLELKIKERTKQIKDREEELSLSLDNAHDAIFWFDQKGIITKCNQAAINMLKMDGPQIIGADQRDIIGIDFSLILKTKNFSNEIHIKDNEGKIIPVLLTASQTNTSAKTIIVQGIFHDMTEQKKMQEEAMKHQKEFIMANMRAKTEKKKSEELEQVNEQLNRFNKIMVGRELQMIKLKEEINTLLEESGQDPKYKDHNIL